MKIAGNQRVGLIGRSLALRLKIILLMNLLALINLKITFRKTSDLADYEPVQKLLKR